MSRLKAIAIRNRSRIPMQPIDSAKITLANGILGDFRGPQTGRQITVLSEIAWQKACESLDLQLPWTTRRANLLVDGVEFSESDIGKTIRIGEAELTITEETAPCSLMDQQHQGLRSALVPDWRGGVCCNVIKPGEIQIGDSVEVN